MLEVCRSLADFCAEYTAQSRLELALFGRRPYLQPPLFMIECFYKKQKRAKTQKMKENKTSSFLIHSFMIDQLGLSGTELLVFALIYSFTKAGSSCYGSYDYIAGRVGASISTVGRAIKHLLEKNYIVRLAGTQGAVGHFEANVENLCQNESQNDIAALSNCNTASVKLTDNNREIKKGITPTTTKAPEVEKKPERLMAFGSEQIVMMSWRQYMDLVNKIGDENTDYYIEVLQSYMIRCPGSHFKSHYKTILAWSAQDASI